MIYIKNAIKIKKPENNFKIFLRKIDEMQGQKLLQKKHLAFGEV